MASSDEEASASNAGKNERVFVKSTRLGNFKWPDDSKDEQELLSDEELESILYSFLEGHILVQGEQDHQDCAINILWEEDHGLIMHDHDKMPLSTVAKEIVVKRQGIVIDRSRKALEGFAHKVRNKLESIAVNRILRKNYVPQSSYLRFLNSDLPQMYQEIKDPVYYYKLAFTA